MEIDNQNMVSEHSKITELASNLDKVQHELNIAQKVNRQIFGELRMWKEKSVKLENSLKQEKRNNQKNISELGFKMLQFENHLRKEQRDIESKFIEKDSQIKVLEDVISSLHTRIKKNSLCYNCFVVKHNSPERCASPDSYATKFPLDMDFSDHKLPAHGAPDVRSRNMSLPLNMQSTLESPKANSEFCFHHMLSPVPEELEVSVLEHAKRISMEPHIEESSTLDGIEVEETETLEYKKDKEEQNENVIERQDGTGYMMAQSGSDTEDVPIRRDNTEAVYIEGDNEEKVGASDLDLNGRSEFEVKETTVIDQSGEESRNLPLNSEKVEDETCVEKQSEMQQTISEEEFGLNSEVHSVMNDIISRVESLLEHNHHMAMESISTANQNPKSVPDSTTEASDDLNKKEEARMPLSPKSEAIVAELKRAIFDASLEHEKKNDVTSEADSSNLEKTAENISRESEANDNQNKDAVDQNKQTVINPDQSLCNSSGSVNKEGEEKSNNVESMLAKSSELTLDLHNGLPLNEGNIVNVEDEEITPEVNRIKSSVPENCVDTLTEYDVIELD